MDKSSTAFLLSPASVHSRNPAKLISGVVSTGPFANFPANVAKMGAITTRLTAALNRTTLLIDYNQPDGENPANYYLNSPTNHYARIVHETNLDSRGYAFPYDDVVPTGGADQSGAVYDQNPASLTVVVGGS